MLNQHLKHLAAGFVLATTFATSALADERLDKIENAYQSADGPSLSGLVDTAAGNNKFVAQYRLASLKLGNQQMEQAHALLTDMKTGLEAETRANPDNAEAWALLSSTYGMLSTMEQEKLMIYGQQASVATDRAMDAGPDNPMVLLLTGINKFYTPAQWGGGKAMALDYFDKAVKAYESGTLERTWGHADALVWRGATHAKLGNKEQSKADVDAAIAMEPDYQWARTALDYL